MRRMMKWVNSERGIEDGWMIWKYNVIVRFVSMLAMQRIFPRCRLLWLPRLVDTHFGGTILHIYNHWYSQVNSPTLWAIRRWSYFGRRYPRAKCSDSLPYPFNPSLGITFHLIKGVPLLQGREEPQMGLRYVEWYLEGQGGRECHEGKGIQGRFLMG